MLVFSTLRLVFRGDSCILPLSLFLVSGDKELGEYGGGGVRLEVRGGVRGGVGGGAVFTLFIILIYIYY